MTCSRRDFVVRASAVLAGGAVAPFVGACAPMMMYRVAPVGGQLRVDIVAIPDLERTGLATIQAEGDEAPIFVVRESRATYYALSSVCTHRGCTVDAKGDRFVCPCHGSTYSVAGAVLRGPAELPLQRMRATLQPDGRTLIVEHRRSS